MTQRVQHVCCCCCVQEATKAQRCRSGEASINSPAPAGRQAGTCTCGGAESAPGAHHNARRAAARRAASSEPHAAATETAVECTRGGEHRCRTALSSEAYYRTTARVSPLHRRYSIHLFQRRGALSALRGADALVAHRASLRIMAACAPSCSRSRSVVVDGDVQVVARLKIENVQALLLILRRPSRASKHLAYWPHRGAPVPVWVHPAEAEARAGPACRGRDGLEAWQLRVNSAAACKACVRDRTRTRSASSPSVASRHVYICRQRCVAAESTRVAPEQRRQRCIGLTTRAAAARQNAHLKHHARTRHAEAACCASARTEAGAEGSAAGLT